VSIYAPEFQISQTAYALNVAVRAIDYFEQFFGIAYPMSKIGT